MRGFERNFRGKAIAAGETGVGEGDGEAAVADVVRGGDGAFGGESDKTIDEIFFRAEIDHGRRTSDDAANRLRVFGRGKFALKIFGAMARGRTRAVEQNDCVTFTLKTHAERAIGVFENAENAKNGRGINGATERFVVEADVAAGDGSVEGATSFGDAVNRFAELAHHFGLLGIAEVEAIRGGNGARAGARDVPRGFGDRM